MVDAIGEFDLIARYLRPLADDPAAFALMDDAAVIPVPLGKTLVMSKDVLVGNVHFFADDLPDLIARKALRTNISDIVSKGADPIHYALGLCFPGRADAGFMEIFSEGLEADQDYYGISLLGGDTTRSHHDFMISVTMFGLSDAKGPVTRMGARPGEAIYVSGTLGSAAVGLSCLTEPERFRNIPESVVNDLQSAYLLPQPPFGLQAAIANYASASMDVSDGLLADLAHLCRASGVSAFIHRENIPMSAALMLVLEQEPSFLGQAVRGGDDYQCLMTVPFALEDDFNAACLAAGIKVTFIGETSETTGEGDGPVFLLDRGVPSPIEQVGYTHF